MKLNDMRMDLFHGQKVNLDGKVYWANLETREVYCHSEDEEILGSISGYKVADITDNWEIKEIEEEGDKMKVQFMAGEGRNFQGGVNYLLSTDGRIYAEVKVPESASDDYGYLTMAYAIQKKADEIGLDLEDYRFQYDGQEDYLEDDADADCEVYLEVE